MIEVIYFIGYVFIYILIGILFASFIDWCYPFKSGLSDVEKELFVAACIFLWPMVGILVFLVTSYDKLIKIPLIISEFFTKLEKKGKK